MVNTFGINIIPQNDEQRLEALRRYKILDTPPEEAFTNLAHLVAGFFKVPIALISLVDRDRVQFKGNVGMTGVKNVDRGKSLCSLAVLSSEPTIIEQPLDDPCLLANPLVYGDFGLRFYAGAPLVTADGFNIGTVCIVDKQPRQFTEKDKANLVRFSKVVMDEIELRLAGIRQREVEQELYRAQTQLYAALKAGKVTPFHWDLRRSKVFGGPELAYLFGLDHQAAVDGLPISLFIQSVYPEDREQVMALIDQAIKAGKEYEAEYRTIGVNQEVRWVIARAQVQVDAQNAPGSFTGILIDITEKKEAENMLKYRTAVLEAENEATSDGILIVDAQGKIISYNSRFSQMWGFPAEIIDSKDDARALAYAMTLLEDPEAFLQKVTHLYNHPAEKSIDELHFKDGRVFERYGSAVRGNDGTYYGWAWFFSDITDRKRAEEEIRIKNEELRSLYQELQFVTDTIPQLAWATDPDGYTHFFNKGWCQYTGLGYEELKGHRWAQLLHPDDVERTLNAWKEARKKGGIYELEYRLKRHDGAYRWFLARGTPMLDEQGEIIKWYGTTTDIHDRKMMAELLESRVQERTRELLEANKNLRLINADLEQFTYVSHHDLQEPLRKIMMFTDMVKSDSKNHLTDSAQIRLERVSNAARRMSGALKDVLSFAALNKAEAFQEVDLDETLATVQADLELAISEKGAQISSDALPTIKAIPQQMHLLFYNLLNNALKFARPGMQPLIHITCNRPDAGELAAYPDLEQDRSYYKIKVQDNGIGFSQHLSGKIFIMFQRLHTREAYEGTGIGLAVCQKVLENHKGKIWAESQPDEGAVFYMLLPE